jgi:hypothetical protein
MRAADLSETQSTFPRMDLTALYCLGITIQEYARYLNTDLVTQKRQLEEKPALDTLLSPEEINQQSVRALIEKYKTEPVLKPKSTSVYVVPRPNLEDELSHAEKTKRARARHQVEVKTSNKETQYDQLMNNPEWRVSLRAKRDIEAEAVAADKRRADAEKEKLRITAEREQRQQKRQRQQEERQKQQEEHQRQQEERQKQQERQKQLENIPPQKQQTKKTQNIKEEPVDIFDLSSQHSSQKPKKRKVTASKKKSLGF